MMTRSEKYRLMDIIWLTVIDYSTKTPITKVCNAVIQRLKDEGYEVEVLNNNRDFRILNVDGQKFRILRNFGWSKYDVIMRD